MVLRYYYSLFSLDRLSNNFAYIFSIKCIYVNTYEIDFTVVSVNDWLRYMNTSTYKALARLVNRITVTVVELSIYA